MFDKESTHKNLTVEISMINLAFVALQMLNYWHVISPLFYCKKDVIIFKCKMKKFRVTTDGIFSAETLRSTGFSVLQTTAWANLNIARPTTNTWMKREPRQWKHLLARMLRITRRTSFIRCRRSPDSTINATCRTTVYATCSPNLSLLLHRRRSVESREWVWRERIT